MLRGILGSAGGPPVGGSGTTNTIPRWTGPSTLGDSVITQSGNNIGFGLGANTPISRWHALVPNSGASPTASDWTSSFSATGDYRSGFGFQFSAGTPASNRVACLVSNGTNTGQTVVWTADGAGNVGIGTTSPASRLDVAGTITCDDAGTGLKLPATPGNADSQTLDCYAEGTWAPTLTGFGGTTPTVTSARYTRVGRMVLLEVSINATGGATYSGTRAATYLSLPAGMVPPTISAAGAMTDSGINTLGTAVAYYNGNLYLPTFAATAVNTFVTVSYSI